MHGFNWTQFLWLFVVIGAPGISWAAGKLREQYEKKKRRDMARVRETEDLRIQRPAERIEIPNPEEERAKRLAELAARRQAQLEQLRQRRTTGAAPSAPPVVLAPTPGVPRPAPQRPTAPGRMRPGVPGVPMRGPAAGQPARPVPVRRGPTMVAIPTPAAPPSPPMAAPPMASVRNEAPPPSPVESVAEVTRAPAAAVSRDVRAVLRGAGPESKRRLATALALSEVLAPPVSMRSG